MPEGTASFVATGLVISSIWVIWVALHAWSRERPSDRTPLPALITAVAIGTAFLLVVMFRVPRPWAGLAVFVAPAVGSFYLRRGLPEPGRRPWMRVGLVVAFVATLAGLLALDSVNLLL
jgi:hypothetical protein